MWLITAVRLDHNPDSEWWIDQHDTSVGQRKKFMSSSSSVDRAPAQFSGGHWFYSCLGCQFLLCPMLMSCWSIHLSHFIIKLTIHHLYSLITFAMTFTVRILAVCSTNRRIWTQFKRPCSPWGVVAQWIECRLVFRWSWVGFLSETQIFPLSCAHIMLIYSPFTFHYWA